MDMEQSGDLQLDSGIAFVHGDREFSRKEIRKTVEDAAVLFAFTYWQIHEPPTEQFPEASGRQIVSEALGQLRQEELALRDAIAEMALKVLEDNMEPRLAHTLIKNQSARSVIEQYAARAAGRIYNNL